MTYLINENSPDSAGEYDDSVADVLLRESEGWHVANPVTGELLDPVETEDTSDPASVDNPTENGESADLPKE